MPPRDPEYRAHQRLQAYWDSLRGAQAFPGENQVDPGEIDDIWPSCFLISIDDVTRRLGYRYSYLGAELIEAYGDDAGDPEVAMRLISTANSPMAQQFDAVVREKKPVIDEAHFINLKQMKIHYRACMLPLGMPGGEVTHILGCMRWKIG